MNIDNVTLPEISRHPAHIFGQHATDTRLLSVLSEWDLTAVEDSLRRDASIHQNIQRLTSEYRKFVYLAVASRHPCVPSRDIDEVWHAHILHSRDYVAFCNAIGREYIHHQPSPPDERAELEPLFQKTVTLYEEVFGTRPEPSIWGTSGMASCVDPGHDCRGTCSHNCKNT